MKRPTIGMEQILARKLEHEATLLTYKLSTIICCPKLWSDILGCSFIYLSSNIAVIRVCMYVCMSVLGICSRRKGEVRE